MTCSENGLGFISSEFKFILICQLSRFMNFHDKHETGLCIKCEKRLWITNDDVVACVKSQKIEWMPLRLAIWNIIKYRMYVWTPHISPTTIRAPTNLQIYLNDRLSQVSVQWGYCLFWMMHTTLYNNCTNRRSAQTKHLIVRKLHNR